ncbi:kinase-like domain-containing protein [Mycena maculata]|uniref:Kinase-like domain-containing protein n=1 Tax=Mycena maculata TaxID=230809 RepID=A0AAD7HJV4_9AGAR|nr:kinase-like domain-containing protein [Mycena maculata]
MAFQTPDDRASDDCEPLVATQPVDDPSEIVAATGSLCETEVSWEEVPIVLSTPSDDEPLVATQPTNESERHPAFDLNLDCGFLMIPYPSAYESNRKDASLKTLTEPITPPPNARHSPMWSFKESDKICQVYDHRSFEYLSQGASSVVSRAIAIGSNKKVAVKRMRFKGCLPDIQWQGRTEITNLQSLKDFPGVNQIIEVFEDEIANTVDIVLELESGGDLFTRAIDHDLGEDTSKNIVRQICGTLARLHRWGVTHRDVKPHNILLSDSSTTPIVKIADFGHAKRELAAMKTLCGTAAFMAPEIVKGRPYDIAVDAWSFGITVALLLSRKCSQILDDIHSNGFDDLVVPKILSCLKEEGATPDGQNFVLKLLEIDPKTRMSCQQALKHPWLSTPRSEPMDEHRAGTTLIERTSSLNLLDLNGEVANLPTATLPKGILKQRQGNVDKLASPLAVPKKGKRSAEVFEDMTSGWSDRKRLRFQTDHEKGDIRPSPVPRSGLSLLENAHEKDGGDKDEDEDDEEDW